MTNPRAATHAWAMDDKRHQRREATVQAKRRAMRERLRNLMHH
jgi:hypothetical protein